PPVSTEWNPHRERGGFHARRRANPIANIGPDVRGLFLPGDVDLEHGKAVGLEPERPRRQIPQRDREEPGGKHHEQAERGLRTHERPHHATMTVPVIASLERTDWPR